MTNNENDSAKSETVKQSDTPSENIIKEKKPFLTEKKVETVVAVLLGITTLLSAWATWIGSLHGGLQSINFTMSNNTASQSSAEYNLCMQLYLSDSMSWDILKSYYDDLETAKAEGDQSKIDSINGKIEKFKKENISDILIEGMKWMEENNEDNPFKMPGMTEKYFESALETLKESNKLLEEGKRDNTKGDSYNLVTVIYSLTLFLLGIVGTFKSMPNRIAVLVIAIVFLIFGIIYMCHIPLPTGFGQMNFFEFNQ